MRNRFLVVLLCVGWVGCGEGEPVKEEKIEPLSSWKLMPRFNC